VKINAYSAHKRRDNVSEKMPKKSKRQHGIICTVKFGGESFEKIYTEYIKKRLGNKA